MGIVKDLSILRWKKDIYYISDGIIFDILSRKNSNDLDECWSYLIDMSNAPSFVKDAHYGALLDLRSCPEVFIENVPYIRLEFISPNGNELLRFFPLQYLIEKGDRFDCNRVKQLHPDIFGGRYVNKFNNDIFGYIYDLVSKKPLFDKKNIDLVLNSLPDWLTMGIEFKYMTESYIDNYFVKGSHYNEKLAMKGAVDDNSVYQFRGAFLGVGTDAIDGDYVPINIWNRDTVENMLRSLYAENIVGKYNSSVKNDFNALSVDSMESIATAIKGIELGLNKKDLRTFLNVSYRDHDCDGVAFESVCTYPNVDTWYEYLKQKDDAPVLNVEEIIIEDKAYVEQYISEHFADVSSVSKYWWETGITMDKYYNADDANENRIESVVNVFTLGDSVNSVVLMIYHEGDSRMVAEHKNAFWVGDNDLYVRESELVKGFDECYRLMMDSEYDKAASRQCTLRAQLGPKGAETPPQYIFGNVHYQLYVNALTGEVLNYSPAYPPEEPDKLHGSAEDIRERHGQLINNRYGLNYWCQSEGSFMDYVDSSSFDSNELYEVNDIFKVEESGKFIRVSENAETQETEEIEGIDYDIMPNDTMISLSEAVNVVLGSDNIPHSEFWSLILDGGIPKYKFGKDSNAVFINAFSGEIIN